MISAALDSKKFEKKLVIFSSGLGRFFASLMRRVGNEMAADARANAPFTDRTGKLRSAIGFIMRGRASALSTRERFGATTVPYAWARERGSYLEPVGPKSKTNKQGMKYFRFFNKKHDTWVTVSGSGSKKFVRTPPQPYMLPVFKKYWRGRNSKGYAALAEALQRKLTENMMKELRE